jgi:hypothetical protein
MKSDGISAPTRETGDFLGTERVEVLQRFVLPGATGSEAGILIP